MIMPPLPSGLLGVPGLLTVPLIQAIRLGSVAANTASWYMSPGSRRRECQCYVCRQRVNHSQPTDSPTLRNVPVYRDVLALEVANAPSSIAVSKPTVRISDKSRTECSWLPYTQCQWLSANSATGVLPLVRQTAVVGFMHLYHTSLCVDFTMVTKIPTACHELEPAPIHPVASGQVPPR